MIGKTKKKTGKKGGGKRNERRKGGVKMQKTKENTITPSTSSSFSISPSTTLPSNSTSTSTSFLVSEIKPCQEKNQQERFHHLLHWFKENNIWYDKESIQLCLGFHGSNAGIGVLALKDLKVGDIGMWHYY